MEEVKKNPTNSNINREKKTPNNPGKKPVNKQVPKKKVLPKEVVQNKEASDIKIFSLGGVGVIGMNMYIVEQNNEILIMDAGILFADDDVHGVNYIIPDFTYLKQNEKKICGLFITHSHEDHIGAIPFLLEKVNVPVIYANGLAVGLINNKMMEWPNIKYNIKEFNDDSVIKTKNFSVSFFRTNHSIPDSFGIAIKTSLGNIVNTGDFKFDLSPLGKMSDFYKMTKLGQEGVYCLIAESTNADKPNFSLSERRVGENLSSLFHQIEGRIIVAAFASNVYRIKQIIDASLDCGRKVIVFGHSMELTIQVAARLKYLNAPKSDVLYARDLKKIESEHVTLLCTGSQGEPMAALSRIASGTHKQIKLLPNDTIIYSSKPIPGNEQFVNRNINKLVHSGAHVIINSPLTDTHTTGHASQNELRLMLAFMKPKYFVPVHGEYMMLKQHVELAKEQGIPKQNCFVLDPGDVLTLNQKGAKVLQKAIPANDVYLDGSLSDVDSTILKDRKKMADNGMVSVTFFINKKKEIINNPIINIAGFATPEMAVPLINSIKQKSIDLFKGLMKNQKGLSFSGTEKQLSNQLGQYIYHKMNRKPVVITAIKVMNI